MQIMTPKITEMQSLSDIKVPEKSNNYITTSLKVDEKSEGRTCKKQSKQLNTSDVKVKHIWIEEKTWQKSIGGDQQEFSNKKERLSSVSPGKSL